MPCAEGMAGRAVVASIESVRKAPADRRTVNDRQAGFETPKTEHSEWTALKSHKSTKNPAFLRG